MKKKVKRPGRIRNELFRGLIAVILLSGFTTYWVVYLSSRQNFDQLVEKNDLEIAGSYASALADYYETAGDWGRVAEAVAALRTSPVPPASGEGDRPADRRHDRSEDIPLVITGTDGVPVYSGLKTGEEDRPGLPEKLNPREGEAVLVRGETVGYVFFKSMIFRDYNPQEAAFIVSLTRSIGISVALGLLLALAVGTFLASRFARPVAALDGAVRSLAEGHMGARVTTGRRDELGSLAENFNRMADQLQAAEEARQNLLADIAHELRTPVSVLQANLEMIIAGVYEPDPDRLKSLFEETRILSGLIGDLRSLSDLEVGRYTGQSEPVSPAELAEETCRKFQPLYGDKGVLLEWELAAEETLILADGDRIRQVFRNLLDNALKYAPRGSVVKVAVRQFLPAERKQAGIRMTVEDQGPGVPEGDTEKIFQRFYRVDPSRNRESGGRGLGLAISRQIVQTFNGRMGAANRETGGLCVWLEFPGHLP